MESKYTKKELNAIHEASFQYTPEMAPTAGAIPIVTTVTTNPTYPTVIGNPAVGPKSTELSCPQCRCRIRTRVQHRSTTLTHIACLMLTFTVCCWCLPYCMDSCRNANHYCPMCDAFIGTYRS